MRKFRVYVAEKSYPDYTAEREIVEGAGGELLFASCRQEKDIIEQCTEAHAILLRQTPVGEKTFRSLKQLRVVARYGTGYDNVDIEAASRHGVLVTTVPDYCIGEVADHTAALLLSAIRKIPLRDKLVRCGGWGIESEYPAYRTARKILGIVGYGKTAREVRRRLAGFPFRFVACDPYIPEETLLYDSVIPLSFKQLVTISHYISIHVPLTEETYHLFNLKTFQMMRRGAVLVNTSRGAIISLDDLYTALTEGYIAAAALDVYESEPFDVRSPLAALNSVILSDHAAWYSEESLKELQRRTALEAVRVLCGKSPEHAVNPEALNRSSVLKPLRVRTTKEMPAQGNFQEKKAAVAAGG